MIDPTDREDEHQHEEDLITPDDDNTDLSEIDPDEKIHLKAEVPSDENIKHDADDAVHRSYKPAVDPLHENQERDPDDMAHGRI